MNTSRSRKDAAPKPLALASGFRILPTPSFFPPTTRLKNHQKPAPGTFAALIEAWQKSPEWGALASKTSIEWLRYLDRINALVGDLRVVALEPKHVLALRDKYAATPASANNLLRCLSSMLSWSIPHGWRADNPCDYVKKLKGGQPYEHWPWEAIELLRQTAPAELWWVAALALYTGQRQGDVLQMKFSDVRDGAVSVIQEKTGVKVWIPIHRTLAAVLADIPRRSIYIAIVERHALDPGRLPHVMGPSARTFDVADTTCLSRAAKVGRRDAVGGRLLRCRSSSDLRTVTADGGSLWQTSESAAARGVGDPQVGER